MNQDRPHSVVGHCDRPFQLIPVIDLMNGQVVHAVGGLRAHYQPIQSILHASSEPISLARAIRDILGLNTLYLADLDAIEGRPPRLDLFRAIIEGGLHVWIDAGVSDVESALPLLALDSGSVTVVAGLETLRGPSQLAELVRRAGADRVVFSLDLWSGRPRMPAPRAWGTEAPLELARAAVDCGVHRLLILDLARVGTDQGPGTNELLAAIRADFPSVEVAGGGGLARIEDVVELRNAGADAALVASAIHDGRIGARELARLAASER